MNKNYFYSVYNVISVIQALSSQVVEQKIIYAALIIISLARKLFLNICIRNSIKNGYRNI